MWPIVDSYWQCHHTRLLSSHNDTVVFAVGPWHGFASHNMQFIRVCASFSVYWSKLTFYSSVESRKLDDQRHWCLWIALFFGLCPKNRGVADNCLVWTFAMDRGVAVRCGVCCVSVCAEPLWLSAVTCGFVMTAPSLVFSARTVSTYDRRLDWKRRTWKWRTELPDVKCRTCSVAYESLYY